MLMNKIKPLRKFGLKRKDQRKNYIYSTLEYGETDRMLREARRLNWKTRKLGDRKYFVWPVGGEMNYSVLVVGRAA